ncbi:asparagine synthase (glutamine-hydrolyzing) [Sphingomonas sp.]|uniref:asparagine synthase (glutamine-hydrolyzing) n=1 Tax=Sphingomonas sp. TaxID=28214 RepID=UPI0025E74103|nr:asparagine synthase (glutamine-hydrolyzing) [Sphingomonas sp.]MBV9527814.1 asparagine synthase (glutamine-hydrolyzing) [Sphingomonas sp.]
MCGIAGWYRRGGRPVGAALVTGQTDAIFHRGPDEGGVLTDGDFGFGMRRLSIIDVAGGHQPMESPDGRYAIIFNGEIYNHLEVRRGLPDYPFRTHSDTETILAAFARWGNDAWGRLEGMFAVAMWDRKTRSLTLARDPLGIKPLHISEQDGGFSFASELKSLTLLPGHEFTRDDRAVHDYFTFGHVRRPRTIYREVRTLDPGHHLTVGPEGEPVTGCYWRPRFGQTAVRSEAEWTEEMREMLLATTARHMLSDVPVAAFLSGGIDSSAVLAAMVRASDTPITAFTIGHPGSRLDETDAARAIASHLGCEHVVAPLPVSGASSILAKVERCYDEPFADMAAIPTWFVSELASHRVKVVLCGEGGDELFAGYKRHRNAVLLERNRGLASALSPLMRAAGSLPASGSARANLLRQHIQRLGEFVGLPDGFQQFFAATQISRSGLREELLDSAFAEKFEGEGWRSDLEREYFPEPALRSLSALEQFLYADLTLNLPSQMLTRLDRASMAHSVEARVPFLSHRMVEWALTVPTDLKLRGRTGKRILREAIRPWLPPEILTRPKQGFQIPMADWLRGPFGDEARSIWNDSGARDLGYLRPATVDRLFAEHRRGAADHSRILYAITVFGLWSSGESGRLSGRTADAA